MTNPVTPGPPLLAALQAAHVFDPVPPRAGVHGFHVPFDELTGTQHTEFELARAIGAVERTAVAGRSGVGKTSLIQHVIDLLTDTAAAIRIPVEAESAETVSEPQAFAAHLIRTVARYLDEARLIDPAARRSLLAGSAPSLSLADRRTGHGSLGLPRWAMQAEVAGDVESVVTADVVRSAGDVIAQARDIIEAIAARGLTPVLVIDDSDAWLATAAGDRTSHVGPFFTRVVRMLAEELNASLIVAVHDHYLRLPAYPINTGFLEQTIHVPPLPDANALGRILHTRINTFDFNDVSLDLVIDESAVSTLFDRYQSVDGNIRTTLLAAHTALQAACDDHSDRIADAHIQIALTRYEDSYGDI